MSKYLIAFALFAMFFLVLPYVSAGTTPPVTTFNSFQVSETTDQNITLSCTDDNSGCKAINYNVNNEGWNYIRGIDFNSDLKTNLISYYTFEESSGNLLDLVGNRNGLNSNITYQQTGIVNYGYNLNGSTSYTNLEQNTAWDINANKTFSFWVNNDTNNTVAQLLNNYALNDGYDIYQSSGTLAVRIKGNGGGQVSGNVANVFDETTSWKHIVLAVNWGDSNALVYVNGVLKTGINISTTKGTGIYSDTNLNLGRRSNDGVQYFDGYYDEVGIWDRLLSFDEVLELYNDGNGISYYNENIDSYSFLYSGAGDHNIQYFSTDNADNNEAINTSEFTTYGLGKFTFYDEDDDSLLNDVVYTISPAINGDSGGTLTDTNVLDLNLQGISSDTYTFTFSKTGYGTRYYTQTLTELNEFDLNFLMLPTSIGRNIEFQVYQADETTLYTNTYIYLFNWNKQMGAIGRRQTDSSGKVTFFVNPNDANYTMRIYGTTTIDYNSMTLTINHPRDESTGTTIDGNWELSVTGLAWQNYTDLNGDQAIQIYANTTDDYGLQVGDSDANYYDRKYYVSYVGATTSATLSPYLVPIADAVSTTIYTISGFTQQPVGSITIKIYKTIVDVGRVLVEQVTTDAKGEALVSLIANDEYEFEIYRDGTLLGSQAYRITSTSTAIYISVDDLSITEPILEQGLIDVIFTPRRTHLIGSDTAITQTIDIVDYNTTITFINALIYITNTDVNGVSGNDVNIYSNTITTLTNSIAFNSTLKTIGGVTYDTNGTLIVHVIVTTNKGTYYEKYVYKPPAPFDFFQELGFDIRPTFGCAATNDPLIPCPTMLFIALFVSILITIAFAIETGFTGQESMAGLFLVIMGIFTYLAWVPIGLMGLLTVSVIMLMIAIGGRNKV